MIGQFLSEWKDIDGSGRSQDYINYLLTSRGQHRQYVLDNLQEYYRFLDIQPDQRVLDIGCGTGFDVEMLLRLTKDMRPQPRIYGCDRSMAMFAACQKYLAEQRLHARIYMQDVYRMWHFTDGYFHRVFSRTLFQHLADPEKAVQEMVRVTRLNGILAAVETDWMSFELEVPTLSSNEEYRQEFHKFFASPSAARDLPALFTKAGLADVHDNVNTLHMSVGIMKFKLNQHTVVGRKGREWNTKRLRIPDDAI